MSRAPRADNLPFPPTPVERFAVASIDCPWHFDTRAPSKDPAADRSPQRHYPTASIEHLYSIPMSDILAKDAWLAFWITGPLLALGVQVGFAKAWDLEISGMGFDWLKLWPNTDMDQYARTPLLEQDVAVGGGYTTRKNLEYVVLMKRGKPPVLRRDIRALIISPRREHSRKPEEFYRRMEAFAPGPRLDMFGGRPRVGWTAWGWGHREGENDPYEAEGIGA